METYFLTEKIGSYVGSRAHTRMGMGSRLREIPLLNFTSVDSGKDE